MRTILKIIAIAFCLMPVTAFGQFADQAYPTQQKNLFENMKEHGVLNTIELAANIGTTGIGLEVASPLTEWAKVRAGVDWMPTFTVPMTFGMESYVDGKINDKFDRIQNLMYEMSGMAIDKEIEMESKPTMTTFRLLVDVYPFKTNKHWHFTVGFFVGGNSVGKSLNNMKEMPSLLGLNMYNRFYDQYKNVPTENEEAFQEYIIDNPISFPILGEQYIDPDPDSPEFQLFYNKFRNFQAYGELGVHVGDHKDGTPYMMTPDKDGTVSAKAKVNRFRPYVGFGYGGALSSDGKWQASFDAGVQFWGGVPKVVTHDGTVLNDLVNLRGKVGKYMDLMKLVPVYPTIDFRISYRF